MCISLRVLDCWSSTILPGGWKSLSILTGDQILRPQWNQAVLGLFRSLTSFSPQGQRWELLVKRLQCSQCSQCNNVYYTILQNDPIWGIQQTTFSFTTFLQTAQDAWNRTGDWCNCFLPRVDVKKKQQQQQPVQDLSDESQVVVTLVTSKNAWTNSFDPDILRNPAILPPMVRHVTAFDGSQSARRSKKRPKKMATFLTYRQCYTRLYLGTCTQQMWQVPVWTSFVVLHLWQFVHSQPSSRSVTTRSSLGRRSLQLSVNLLMISKIGIQ